MDIEKRKKKGKILVLVLSLTLVGLAGFTFTGIQGGWLQGALKMVNIQIPQKNSAKLQLKPVVNISAQRVAKNIQAPGKNVQLFAWDLTNNGSQDYYIQNIGVRYHYTSTLPLASLSNLYIFYPVTYPENTSCGNPTFSDVNDGKYIQFPSCNFKLKAGETKRINLMGDLAAGTSGRSYMLYLQAFVDPNYSVNLSVSGLENSVTVQ
ncbi:hypothetical protein JW911_05295 [Candidatus Peregrinibacteria bacterium]|nr:hypothetical protein [Candidatus Peregrinibacteria bacterium]